jgi:Uncharacterised protein family UPF0547
LLFILSRGLYVFMALTVCPECAGQVSAQAERCPHCGYPFRGQRQRLDGAIEQRFRELMATKGPIHAVKYLREETGMSLTEAKAWYDRMKADTNVRRGCLTLIVLAATGIAHAGTDHWH